MSGQLVGADLEALGAIERGFERQAAILSGVTVTVTNEINRLDRLWSGPDAAAFTRQWVGMHRPRLLRAVAELGAAAATIERNRLAQDSTSAADDPGTAIPPGGPHPGAGSPTPTGDDDGWGGEIADFLFGDVVNFWNGGGDGGFPVGQLGAAAIKMWRIGVKKELPLFNTGLGGRGLSWLLSQGPGPLPRAGAWLTTPGANTVFTRAGIVGGVVSTGIGVYDLYQQGNPIDAFQREGAGYVADVASTAFSASTTAFLIAPNPVTAGLAVGTGLVWAGAEVVDNWDEITEWSSDAWDAGAGVVGDVWDAGGAVVDKLTSPSEWF